MKKVSSKLYSCLLGLGIIVCDVWIKNLSIKYLQFSFSPDFPYGGKAVFKGLFGGVNFCFNLVKNHGAAWGIFSEYTDLLAYVRIAIVVYLLFKLLKGSWRGLKMWGISLIMGGATGNLIDYFRFGYVIDMFHFTFWGYSFPVFNFADAAISIGALCLLFSKGRLKL